MKTTKGSRKNQNEPKIGGKKWRKNWEKPKNEKETNKKKPLNHPKPPK